MFSLSVLIVGFFIFFIFSDVGNCKQNASDLSHHDEVHRAKNLIDALSMKLLLNVKTYNSKYSSSRLESLEYLTQANGAQNELNMLKQLKRILSKLSGHGKSSPCNSVYLDHDFTWSRPIIIRTGSSSLPKNYTVKLQVNHRSLIDNGLALDNGKDLRVSYQSSGENKAKEIDRVLKNMGTTKATILFQLQDEVKRNTVETSKYILTYGNKNPREPKQNPENVYLFYDDFSDENLERKWQRNLGKSQIRNGTLELKTSSPKYNGGEVGVFVKDGDEWENIEVELAMMEKNNNRLPAAFLRIKDPSINNRSAWCLVYKTSVGYLWFVTYKKNKARDALFAYGFYKQFVAGIWMNTKYRIVGDRFSHWIDNKMVRRNIKVPSAWMIPRGTLGLGCYTNSKYKSCHTYYDDIKVTKYVSPPPTISLGKECKVDLTLLYGVGTSENNPATSCKQIHDVSLHNGEHRLNNGVYWIKTAVDHSVQTYCDLVNGGWTLVGKISGNVGNIYKTWLVSNNDVKQLSSPELPSSKRVSCIDARYLATYHASTVMFASGENRKGIGSKWVQWYLPAARELETLWNHSVGYKTVYKARMEPVTVKAWNGGEKTCYQNKFGILPYRNHGGSYPSTSYNNLGNTKTNDNCMAIGVQYKGIVADGWRQSMAGYDSPQSNNDWLNKAYNHGAPVVTVWLK